MKIYERLEEYLPHEDGACVALGFFDGVHLGHRAVIGGCAADSGDLPGVVLTFRESPAKALGRPVPPLLCDNARKATLIAQLGADEMIFADFADIRELSPADFVQTILLEKLHAKRIYCGFNYRFGKDGAGDTAALEALCAAHGITVCVQEPVFCGGEQVSSSLIRERIAAGETESANRLLGCRYAVTGMVGSGNGLGKSMGFPTVNLPIGAGMVTPKYGVYASDLMIGGERYRGATNIGLHPTVGASEQPVCETFLLDFGGGDLYGREAVCELIAFIRPERRFNTTEELVTQIKEDCAKILAI